MRLKKGDQVVMHTCGEAEHEKGKIWTVKTDVSQMCGEDVVWLEGYSGCFVVEFLQKVDITSIS